MCSPCTARYGPSGPCTWGLRKGRSAGVSKQELLRLQRRIDELESGGRYAFTGDRAQAATSAVRATMAATTTAPPLLTPRDRASSLDGDGTNDGNAMMGLDMEDELQDTLDRFGDSSATSFMNQIQSVIDQQVTPPDLRRQPSSQTTGAPARPANNRRLSKQSRPMSDYVLPSRQRADHLLETYWRLVDTLYPFLDKDEVVATYRCLWTGEPLGDEEPIFLCLLNIIFAIASILDPATRPEERVAAGDNYYQRARQSLDFELVHRRSILTVQCSLLLGQYLQSTDNPQQCWIFVGLAIRIAQSLGLDLPSTSAQAQTPQRRDLLRKVWHGCVLMDRTLSMTFGRPPMITSQAAASVPRPTAHQDEHNSHSGEPHFFVESLKVYELMSETLSTLYSPASRAEPSKDPYTAYFGNLGAKAVGNICEMDSRFSLWSHALPSHLRHEPNVEKTGIHLRQANVLWLRYRHTRVLLFRPVLSRFCSKYKEGGGTPQDAMLWKIAFEFSVLCVRTALETIDFFRSTMEGQEYEDLDDLLPAWWYSIFYVYTAATVLVAARLHPAIAAEISDKIIMDAWHSVLMILDRFQAFTKHAKRCAAAVTLLFDQVPQQQRHQQQQRVQRHRHQQTLQQQQQPLLHNELEARKHHYHVTTEPSRTNSAVPNGTESPARPYHVPEATFFGAGTTQMLDSNPSHSNLLDTSDFSADQGTSTSLLETYDMQLDLADMSWLSSIPFQLYGD